MITTTSIDGVHLVDVDAVLLLDQSDVLVEALADQDQGTSLACLLVVFFREHILNDSLDLFLGQEGGSAGSACGTSR